MERDLTVKCKAVLNVGIGTNGLSVALDRVDLQDLLDAIVDSKVIDHLNRSGYLNKVKDESFQDGWSLGYEQGIAEKEEA